MFRHPNYYKNLRKLARNRKLQEIVDGIAASATDQAISKEQPDGVHTSVRPGPSVLLKHGYSRRPEVTGRVKQQATSVRPGPGPKQQASSVKPQAPEASSDKRQAPSNKPQA